MFNKKEYKRQWREENKEHVQNYAKQRYKNYIQKVGIEIINENRRKKRIQNKEKINEQKRKLYSNNKDNELLRSKKYRNSEHGNIIIKIKKGRYRIRKKTQSDNSISYKAIVDLILEQDYKCIYCGSDIKEKNHLDHIIPISKGGGHSINNVQFLCPKCNLVKSNKLVFRNYG